MKITEDHIWMAYAAAKKRVGLYADRVDAYDIAHNVLIALAESDVPKGYESNFIHLVTRTKFNEEMNPAYTKKNYYRLTACDLGAVFDKPSCDRSPLQIAQSREFAERVGRVVGDRSELLYLIMYPGMSKGLTARKIARRDNVSAQTICNRRSRLTQDLKEELSWAI